MVIRNYRVSLSENTSLCLDFIRAMAAQMVVIGHGISFMGILMWLHEPPEGYFPWMQNIGVVIFFLLSGLLIAYTTFNKMTKSSYNFKTFFVERFSRIYSGYIPALFIIAILDAIYLFINGTSSLNNSYNLSTFVGNVFMLQDLWLFKGLPMLLGFAPSINVTNFGMAQQLWAIACEWWIYMFFGWLFLGRVMVKNRFTYFFVLLLFSIVPIYFAWPGSRGGGLAIVWAMGCVIAITLNFKVKWSIRRWSPFIAATLLILAALRTYWVKNAYDLPFALLLMGGIYFLLAYTNDSKIELPKRIKKIIRICSGYSMTLYLLHYSVFVLLTAFLNIYSPYILFAVGVILSNILALIVAYFTEMRYKDFRAYLLLKLKV